jgi:hypothetical protein
VGRSGGRSPGPRDASTGQVRIPESPRHLVGPEARREPVLEMRPELGLHVGAAGWIEP